jgi:hypothetical protein
MNKYKALAILFTILLIGALKETLRILTSDAEDIKPNRTELIVMACVFTTIILYFTIRFWKKANEKQLL